TYAHLFHEELRLVQRAMQLAIHGRSACLDVGDVEDMRVRAAREADGEPVSHRRVRAVTAGDVGRLAGFFRAVGAPQTRAHAVARVLEAKELDAALDGHAELA